MMSGWAPRRIKPDQVVRIEEAVRIILDALGEDLDREDLQNTPERVARAWVDFMTREPGNTETTFMEDVVDELVLVHGVRVWSYCAHHLLPFYTDLAMGYVTRDRVIGLSKMARIAHKHAHRLQTQESLIANIADELSELVRTEDVAVVGQGVHLCMVMRGIQTPGTMTTSHMRGRFRDVPQTRSEFLSLIARPQAPVSPH